MAMVAISSAFVAVSITASISAQRGSIRDQRSKGALAAADAGVGQALLRQNRYQATSVNPCVYIQGSQIVAGPVASDGWCPEVVGSVGGIQYRYRVSPGSGTNGVTMVSTGTADGVIRRVAVSARPVSGAAMLADEGVIGQDSITLSGNPDIRVSTGTNGNVSLQGSASICGNIRHGTGKQVSFTGAASQCPGYEIIEGDRILPPIILPAGLANSNSNGRLVTCTATNVPAGCQLDTYSKKRTSTTPWNPATRTISVSSNATLTMGGGDYFICKLDLSNGNLIMASGARIRIYFDTPENCGIPSGGSQIDMGGNANVSSTAFNPVAGNYDLPGFYLLGSPSIPTSANLGGTSGANEVVVYGPNTDISYQGNASLFGLLAGKTMSLDGNPTINSISGLPPQNFSTAITYRRDRYVECSGAVSSPPDAGC